MCWLQDSWEWKPRISAGTFIPSEEIPTGGMTLPMIVCDTMVDPGGLADVPVGEPVEVLYPHCLVPARMRVLTLPWLLQVAISLNGQDWSQNTLVFKFYDFSSLDIDQILPDRFDSTGLTQAARHDCCPRQPHSRHDPRR